MRQFHTFTLALAAWRVYILSTIDSLPWFSQRRNPTLHFSGCAPRGLLPPHSNSAEIFVQCTYPPSFVILCLLIRKLSCWQTITHTNRRRWKHSRELFATLRRWVISCTVVEATSLVHAESRVCPLSTNTETYNVHSSTSKPLSNNLFRSWQL